MRVRDEGDKTTLTFKRRRDDPNGTHIDDTKEIEVMLVILMTPLRLLKEAGWP